MEKCEIVKREWFEKNMNFRYCVVLYDGGSPVGFIDREGFLLSTLEKTCISFVNMCGEIVVKRLLNPALRESVRVYKVSYNLSISGLSVFDAEEVLQKATVCVRFKNGKGY